MLKKVFQNREERTASIPPRLLLDNLSDEEEQIADELKMQKCNFFQDLLLSTLTDRKLTMKVTGKYRISFFKKKN